MEPAKSQHQQFLARSPAFMYFAVNTQKAESIPRIPLSSLNNPCMKKHACSITRLQVNKGPSWNRRLPESENLSICCFQVTTSLAGSTEYVRRMIENAQHRLICEH